MERINFSTTWIGIGNKSGGILFVVGMEGTSGRIWNLGNPQMLTDFSITNARFGLGLGGTAAQMVLVVAFNCAHGGDLMKVDVNDWSVNVSLGSKWSAVVSGFKQMPTLMKAARALNTCLKGAVSAEQLDGVRNLASYLYSNLDIASAGSSPKLICLDIPAVGYSVELSAGISTGGKMELF